MRRCKEDVLYRIVTINSNAKKPTASNSERATSHIAAPTSSYSEPSIHQTFRTMLFGFCDTTVTLIDADPSDNTTLRAQNTFTAALQYPILHGNEQIFRLGQNDRMKLIRTRTFFPHLYLSL